MSVAAWGAELPGESSDACQERLVGFLLLLLFSFSGIFFLFLFFLSDGKVAVSFYAIELT